MKNNVNFVYDIENDNKDEIKHWFFLENVRIQQEKLELEEEKKILEKKLSDFDKEKREFEAALKVQQNQLVKEKQLFEKQWSIIERELKRMAADRDKLEYQKKEIKTELDRLDMKKREVNYCQTLKISPGSFFAGVNSAISLKKRYRELLKIFHPDNKTGDLATIHCINTEYLKLKKEYGIYE